MANQLILSLSKQYSRAEHINGIPQKQSSLPDALTYIYNPSWDTNSDNAPYEILTQIMDCYYCLPERPDLATLFCWQAINHSYNEYSLSDSAIIDMLKDSEGIDRLIKKIENNFSVYKGYLVPYIKALPDKAYRFVASYILKGYVIDRNNMGLKYANQSYKQFKKRHVDLYDVIARTYGDILFKNSTPTCTHNHLHLHADQNQNRRLTYSLASNLRKLVEEGSAEFEMHDGSKEEITFTDIQSLGFVIRFILYASRCSNFHGNVASRLNSDNAREKTFEMYTNMFLLEYMLLAISLHIQGYLTDECLNNLKSNEDLLL